MTDSQPVTTTTAAATAADLRSQIANGSSVSSRAYSTVSETAVLIRPQQPDEQELDRIYGRVSWRLMPLFLAVMLLNHVDRTNLAYAAITMNADLQIGPATYGLGSALFFIPFCIFQIPSNLVVSRVGVRRWLGFLLLGWGTVASCMSLIHNVTSFFILRLLLGTFESGAVPAMWYHLSTFYPADRITKPFAALTIGILVAQAVSGPVAAAFLFMDGLCGMRGWQWLFLLEGLPTVLLSAVVWFCLPESPACSPWLNENDKKILAADLGLAASKPTINQHQLSLPSSHPQAGQQRSQMQHLADHGVLKLLWTAVRNPYLLYMCALGVLLASASNTYVFFLPMIINALITGRSTPMPGGAGKSTSKLLPVILTCIPYTLAAVSCWGIAHSSQKRKELYFHTALPAIVGGVFFVLFPFLSRVSMAAGFASLVLVAVTAACSIGPKTAIVHRITAGSSQVIGMPFYNSIIVLGGFAGPYITGIMVQKTGNFAGASLIFGVFLLIVGSLIIVLKYLLAWEERRRAKQLADSRRCSEAGAAGAGGVVPVRAEHAVTLGNADGKAHGCAAEDAAADVGGAVVMRTDRETNVRPRTLASGGTSGQGL